MCVCYTKAFVRTGLLKDEQRRPFSSLPDALLARIDFEKGKNEIPLIDTESGTTLYGIDALLEVLDQKIPFIKKIGTIRPVKWLLNRLYKFISYNRKVIVAKKCGAGGIDCAPAFSYKYRVLFLLVFFVFNTLMLIPVHHMLQHLPFYHLTITELQLSHLGLAVLNCILALTFTRKNALEYLGQINMLALITVLLLVPLIFLCKALFAEMIIGYLLLLTLFIFYEYLRRMEYANVLIQRKWIVSIHLASLLLFLLYIFH